MNRLLLFCMIVLIGSCNPSENSFVMKSKGALLTTNFKSYEEFQEVVQIKYEKGRRPAVVLTCRLQGASIVSELKAGLSEADINNVLRTGTFWDKVKLCFRSPFFVINRQDVLRVFILSRRKHLIFGYKDIAFYDLAEEMMANITDIGLQPLDPKDFSEKGYINTFNHITSQAFMATLFSESLADFIADSHERSTLPALITGDFTPDNIKDVQNGAVDNYVDFINNEWGQELGKYLRTKYAINRKTDWTPTLLSNYLNDMQAYYGEVLQVGFEPINEKEEFVVKFSYKLNRVMKDLASINAI